RLAIEYRDKIDSSLEERMDDISGLAVLDTATPDASSPERRRARIEQLMRNKDFTWIGYVTPAGRVAVAARGLLEGADVSTRPWFSAARERPALLDAHAASMLSTALPSGPEARRFIDLAVPIAGGRGVVGAHIDLAWVARLRADIQGYADSRNPFELLLVQSDGTVLIGPADLVGRKHSLPLGARVGAPAAIDRWQDGVEYVAGGSSSRGIGADLNLGWIVIARERADVAFAPVAELQRAILLLGLGLALAGIGAGWLLAGRLARPLEALASAAAEVVAGKQRAALPLLRDNLEVARLSTALRAMLSHLREQAESLREAQDHLDQRVRERTAELVEVQAQLELEIADTMVARDDLAKAHAQLALALEASQLALWDFDVPSDRVFLGPYWSRMLGGPAVETRSSSPELLALVPEDDRARVVAALSAALDGSAPEYRVEHRVRRPDGSVFWIVSRGRVIEREADGRAKRVIGTNRDITERIEATRSLQESEARFKRAFDSSAVGIALVAPDGRFQRVNRTMQRMLGYTEEEFLATDFRRLTHPEDLADNEALVAETLAGVRDEYEYEKRFLRKDGTPVWVQVDVALVRDELDLPVQLVCQVLDVSARHEAELRIKALALHDPLTGLPNKRLLEDRLAQAFAAARRKREPIGVLYMDLDDFKPVNDSLGHAAGDELLREVARRGVAALRESDTLARAGGDEFIAVLPGTSREALRQTAERLMHAIGQPYALGAGTVTVGASIGAALSETGAEDPMALLRRADAAMYEAKRAGRNTVRFAAATDQDNIQPEKRK
ncbi:MAG TPA: diguanylate cyclase, partial [Burkholderiales bacterium]|nr:diguanylate cyclase [Burkholderiales bacterium]